MREATRDELAERLGDPSLTIIDVRTRAEYDGRLGAPCCARRGHVAGAMHLDLAELVELDADAIRARLALPEGAEIVAYCHSGSRSAMAAQLLRAAGYDARNYSGSWHEWSRDETLPIEP
jgi:thiosulfate/3-mercaptopyruvate sulfurtransferase